MGRELTIIAVAAVFIFGWMFFTRSFCKGKFNGLSGTDESTGETGSLCYSGPSIIPGMEDEEAPAPEDGGGVDMSKPLGVTLQEANAGWPAARSTPNCDSKTHRCVCAGGTRKIQMSASESCGDCVRKCGSASSGYARSYYVNNQITIA